MLIVNETVYGPSGYSATVSPPQPSSFLPQ